MPGTHLSQPIPIEALSEYDVQEILLDGREILEKPETPAEHFQRILNQIDFKKVYPDTTSLKEAEYPFLSKNEDASIKIWTLVREASKTALVEINAFTDILTVLKDGKYLSVFPVASEPPETRISLVLVGKKKALSTAANILTRGSDGLRQRHLEVTDARTKMSSFVLAKRDPTQLSASFQEALIQLRQEWRIKLHQNCILGDVSLRSVGSRFREPGNFEIREADIVAQENANHFTTSSGTEVHFSRSVEAMLNSAVGSGQLSVRIHEAGIDTGPTLLWSYIFADPKVEFGAESACLSHEQPSNCEYFERKPVNQRERLVKAQRILACREILHTLSCDASGLRDSDHSPTNRVAFASSDEVIATLFPGVQISISLASQPHLHGLDSSEYAKRTTAISEKSGDWPSRMTSLGIQLHRLLARQHQDAWDNIASLPQPTTGGPVQVPARLRAAGANALPASHFTSAAGGNPAVFSIPVASVAGFAGPAASAWSSLANRTSKGTPVPGAITANEAVGSNRLSSVAISQERLALFTEWGTASSVSQSLHGPMTACTQSAINPFDDSISGSAGVTAMEQMLIRRGADEAALRSVLGAGKSLLDQTIALARHCYLREKVFQCLTRFSRTTPVRMVAHWDAINSALLTSVRLCFYATNYDAFRSWLGLTISPTGVTVYHSDPPVIRSLGLNLVNGLTGVLENQVLHTQLHFIELLSTKILGWTRLGNNSCSVFADPEETDSGPMVVKMLTSPSGKNCICLRASLSTGIRVFVASSSLGDSFGLHPIPAEKFREVDLSAVNMGPHALAKIEAIMTALS